MQIFTKNNIDKKKINYLLIFIYIFFILQLIFKLKWYEPFDSADWDSHWKYLRAVTFSLIHKDSDWPGWMYAPWYYFLCAYTFGVIFYLFKFLNILNFNQEGITAMYTFLFSNCVFQMIMATGTLRLARKLFTKNISIFFFLGLACFLPYAHKSTYHYVSENLAQCLFPWMLYYLIKYFKKNNINNLLKFSIIFSLFATNKMNCFVIAFPVLFYLLTCRTLNEKKFDYKILILPILISSLLLFLSFILHKGIWIWDSPVLRDPNLFPGYADKPSLQIFYTVNLFDALKNPLNQNYSMLNRWAIDFFGDYSHQSFILKKRIDEKDISYINSLSVIATFFFIFWYLICLTKILYYFSFNLVKNFQIQFSVLFFLIIPLYIGYSFVVFNKDLTNSFDLRYSGFLIFFLIYPLVYQFEINKNLLIKKISAYLSSIFILTSWGFLNFYL